MSNLPEAFSERLQALRENRQLTRTELADELGTTRQAVWRWETGERKPDYTNLMKLMKLFPNL